MACNCALPQYRKEFGFGFITRYDWLVDSSPTGNIHRRDVVSKASEPANHTGESRLIGTISFINVTASRAGATGISRVNQKYRNTSTFRFVAHESAKLVEGPTVQACPLRATNRNPRPDAPQIFQGNRSICVFRLGNQLLANTMIDIFRKPAFFAGKFLQLAFGRPRAFGLQLSPQAAVTVTHIVDVAGRVDFSITIYRDVHHAQIYAQNIFHHKRLSLFNFAGRKKVEHPWLENQISFTLLSFEQIRLLFAAYKWDAQAPCHCPDGNGSILQSPGQDAIIVGDAACRFESALGLAVQFVCIYDFCNRPNRHLRRKTELFPYCLIALVMQVELSKGFCCPRGITHKPTGGIGLFECLPDGGSLFGMRDQFDLSNQLHAQYCSTNVLGHPALILFLLTFLDISLDGFRTDVSSRTNVIALRPQCCVSAPIPVADTFKLFSQPVRSNPFEQTNDFGRRKLRRCAHKQVYMVGHDLNCQYLQPVLCGDFRQQLFQSRLNRPNQDLFTIARYPNKMVIDCLRAVRGVVGFAWHRYILAKEGGFLHPLKQAGFRRQDL